MNAATFCLKVLGSDSRSIGEPLTLATLQGNLGTAHVIHAKLGAGVLSKIKFGQISVQMLLATVLIHANHAALEHGKEPFQRVRVNLTAILAQAHIADAVIDKLMLLGHIKAAINLRTIGVQDAFGMDIGPQHILSGHFGGL